MVAGAIGIEQMRGAAVDAQAHRVAMLDAAVALILSSDRLAVGQMRIDQGAVAEPLDQIDLADRCRGRRPSWTGPARPFSTTRVSTWLPSPSFTVAKRPPGTSSAGASVIAGEPTKRATKVLAGRL
jgi:hypothetical protein